MKTLQLKGVLTKEIKEIATTLIKEITHQQDKALDVLTIGVILTQ